MIRSLMSVHRIYNFSAGPAVLPVEFSRKRSAICSRLPGVGMSVMEISHRSKPFEDIIQRAEADMRALGGIPANYKVLFLQGGRQPAVFDGAHEPAGAGAVADYIVTGDWAKKAHEGSEEGRRDACGGVHGGRRLQACADAERS